ncbi:Rne/Rng family ribonuclease [Opitutaceae bacterium TAV4]|uniref:Rne/Rng family ribonuclease n=1 Tax=Geminisphaera colitermitum TaxID=1148786 RepID=UPI000158CC31|nr:Rne/Rng family ribonuclease [Geminisphaera colitermitum]RRJ94861.1 Rne/Rng family ribonuclease [Opitutaceae bacterium TAV4]RRJ99092.1 Rne/Rng family ribonuclease [Opitutaceae bacterium TAV3]
MSDQPQRTPDREPYDNDDDTPPANTDPQAALDEQLTHPPSPEEEIPVDRGELKASAQERSKQRPLLQKILSVFKKEKTSYRELIINSEPLEKRVALLIDGVLDKFEIERANADRMVGGIYKGRIKNLDPGLKAAFVDIGYSKNAFLHYWDMLPAATDSSIEVVRVNKKKGAAPRPAEPTVKDIPTLYPPGSDIVIQVTKGPIGTKGPRTTTNLSLPGRYLVLMPFSDQCGISRKIEDNKERHRLKQLVNELTIPEGMGVIVRTAGEGKKARYFVRDLHLLLKTWAEIQRKMQDVRSPACLYQEPDIVERTVRDFLTEEVDRVLIDNTEDHARCQAAVAQISSRSKNKIALYKDNIPIFERFNIERQIEQTFQRKVSLPSGGEIIIDETEALIAIDVNTGSHKNKGGDEKNVIYSVNLEAAVEIARQIRLRNLGGLIICDFIDMKERRHRNGVYEKLCESMSQDRAKTHILPISQLGILQMTRQRQQESLTSNMYVDCPYCRGRGIVKSATTMSVELQRKLSSIVRRLIARNDGKTYSLRVLVHPGILDRLRSEDAELLVRMEREYGVKLAFRADPSYHVENFKIINTSTGEEYR